MNTTDKIIKELELKLKIDMILQMRFGDGGIEPNLQIHLANKEIMAEFSKALKQAEEEGYQKGWNDHKRIIYPYQHKYNKTTKRMASSRHRYHLRKNKKFNNCNLCYPI